MPLRIAALLTCHNRREKTVDSLRTLRTQVLPGWNPALASKVHKEAQKEMLGCQGEVSSACQPPISDHSSPISHSRSSDHFAIEVFLVDDGSTDGTTEAVREIWPEANITHGDGNLYWCGGMRLAWAQAAKTDPDYYLLLNDDTALEAYALHDLLSLIRQSGKPSISVASICDPSTGEPTYGGIDCWNGTATTPTGAVRHFSTFNGNCVLIPKGVVQKIGIFHHAFTHAMADTDYGLKASRNGVTILGSARFLGKCERNSNQETWLDPKLSRRRRFALINLPKGLPFREWLTFCRRNLGWKWWRYAASPYVRIVFGL